LETSTPGSSALREDKRATKNGSPECPACPTISGTAEKIKKPGDVTLVLYPEGVKFE